MRTDLAIEIRESIPGDKREVEGVILKKEERPPCTKITYVSIENQQGAKQMGKPIGTYITLEFSSESISYEEYQKEIVLNLCEALHEILKKDIDINGYAGKTLFVGLGNRFATPDALGPCVMENVIVTNHFAEEESKRRTSALTPGVMGQTGLETSSIIKGVVTQSKPDLVVIIDALAARNVKRLGTTIQLTDTGIHPGAGVGNNRHRLDREYLGVPVISIGVPTVVDARTIVSDCMEDTLAKQGFDEKEIQSFLLGIDGSVIKDLMVTPGNIDGLIRSMGESIAVALNKTFA